MDRPRCGGGACDRGRAAGYWPLQRPVPEWRSVFGGICTGIGYAVDLRDGLQSAVCRHHVQRPRAGRDARRSVFGLAPDTSPRNVGGRPERSIDPTHEPRHGASCPKAPSGGGRPQPRYRRRVGFGRAVGSGQPAWTATQECAGLDTSTRRPPARLHDARWPGLRREQIAGLPRAVRPEHQGPATTAANYPVHWVPTATRLANGTVLLAGGVGCCAYVVPHGFLYDPANDQMDVHRRHARSAGRPYSDLAASGLGARDRQPDRQRPANAVTYGKVRGDGRAVLTRQPRRGVRRRRCPGPAPITARRCWPTARYWSPAALTARRGLPQPCCMTPPPGRGPPSWTCSRATSSTRPRCCRMERCWWSAAVASIPPPRSSFDPASGSWTYTAETLSIHGSHTAALLSDGRVLIVGGYGPTFAELYTPRGHALAPVSVRPWSPPAAGPHAQVVLDRCRPAEEIGHHLVPGSGPVRLQDRAGDSPSRPRAR